MIYYTNKKKKDEKKVVNLLNILFEPFVINFVC
jgi:hypothetical protein